MRSRAVALPAARRLLAASVSACRAWKRRLRYWLIFCSDTPAVERCGASTPWIAGTSRRIGERFFALRLAIVEYRRRRVRRFREAAADVFARPALYWALAAVFAL